MVKSVGYILIALVVLQVQCSGASKLDSAKDKLLKALRSANNIFFKIETYADNRFAGRVKNETGIKEWSVNIQTDVAARVTNQLFKGFEQFKKAILSKAHSQEVVQVLNCISAEEPRFLASVKGAASKNGWCNNRLALNLTIGFKATTSALLEINHQSKALIENLSSCHGSNTICLLRFVQQQGSLYKASLQGGPLGKALQEVQRIYQIMFGQDVPRCNKAILFPQFLQGLKKSVQNVLVCATK